MSKSIFFQRYFKNGWLRGALAGYQGDKHLVSVSKCFHFQVDWNKDVAMLMLAMIRMYQSRPSPQNSYTTSCCLWTVVSKSCSVFAALRGALHAPGSFHIVVLIISILLQRGDRWNIFPQNDVVVVYCLKHLSTWLFDTNSFAFVAP